MRREALASIVSLGELASIECSVHGKLGQDLCETLSNVSFVGCCCLPVACSLLFLIHR